MHSERWRSAVVAAFSGVLFGVGLIASGMTRPLKVKAFLDVSGAWDPSLALVMGGAIAVGIPAFAWARRHPVAWSGARIMLPDSRVIDRRLIGGGVLFGAGWGVSGLCPGPALVLLGGGSSQAAWFVLAMLAGMWLHDASTRRS